MKKEVAKCILCGKKLKSDQLNPFCTTCHAKVQARGTDKWIKDKFKR